MSCSASPFRLRGLLVLGLVVALMGCSGGGGSAPPPSPPTNVEATSQDGAVTLTWGAVSEASAYRVYRTTSSTSGVSGAPLRDGLSEGTFTDTSVENGTQYYYRVTAVGDGGESDPSSEVTVRPFPGPPDRPPDE